MMEVTGKGRACIPEGLIKAQDVLVQLNCTFHVCMRVCIYVCMDVSRICVPLDIPFELQPICGAINHPTDMSI